MRKLLSFLLTLSICLSLISSTAYASSVSLNNTSLTLNEGSSFRLNVYGTTKTVKWSSSDSTIAKVTSRGTVKALKAGTATITATVSSKKLKCKVKVNDVLTNEEAAQNISYEKIELPDDLLIKIKNNNNVNVQAEVEITYYDANDAVLSTDKDYTWVLETGKESIARFSYPHDDDYNNVNFSRYEINITAEVEYVSQDKLIDDITVESNKGSEHLIATLTNNGEEDISSITTYVLYYKNGIAIGYDYGYALDLNSGKSVSVELSEPKDENYDKIDYDDYEIILN